MRVLLGVVILLAFAPPAHAADPCARSRDLKPGPGHGFYKTVAPFEHFTAARTQLFPYACGVAPGATIDQRTSPDDFSTPYIAVTRKRNQLFVYGYGADAATEGGYVSSVNPTTLRKRWTTRIRDAAPANGWSYPGVLAAHGNGYLYAVYGNVMVKLDPDTGKVLRRAELPETAGGTGAAYNGFVVLPDGRIIAKRIERGPCTTTPGQPASAGAITGLLCAVANALPTPVVVIDPDTLKILDKVTPPEPVTGRVTAAGGDVYMAGHDSLFRYAYRDGHLTFDTHWGPVTYRTGNAQPGTGPGVMDGFLVVQTNFIESSAPLTVTAVSIKDSDKVFTAQPFKGDSDSSFIVSKAGLDPANHTVVTHDFGAGHMAALRLDPKTGFHLRWKRALRSLNFSALVGSRRHRQIVISDLKDDGERVVWLDEATGQQRAGTGVLAPTPGPGNIVTPGFGGRFYYTTSAGKLWELRPTTVR